MKISRLLQNNKKWLFFLIFSYLLNWDKIFQRNEELEKLQLIIQLWRTNKIWKFSRNWPGIFKLTFNNDGWAMFVCVCLLMYSDVCTFMNAQVICVDKCILLCVCIHMCAYMCEFIPVSLDAFFMCRCECACFYVYIWGVNLYVCINMHMFMSMWMCLCVLMHLYAIICTFAKVLENPLWETDWEGKNRRIIKCKDVEIETCVIYEKNVVNGSLAEPSVPCGVEGNERGRQA